VAAPVGRRPRLARAAAVAAQRVGRRAAEARLVSRPAAEVLAGVPAAWQRSAACAVVAAPRQREVEPPAAWRRSAVAQPRSAAALQARALPPAHAAAGWRAWADPRVAAPWVRSRSKVLSGAHPLHLVSATSA
jgi:hypothetical protein